jgi:hypothetical protein
MPASDGARLPQPPEDQQKARPASVPMDSADNPDARYTKPWLELGRRPLHPTRLGGYLSLLEGSPEGELAVQLPCHRAKGRPRVTDNRTGKEMRGTAD